MGFYLYLNLRGIPCTLWAALRFYRRESVRVRVQGNDYWRSR